MRATRRSGYLAASVVVAIASASCSPALLGSNREAYGTYTSLGLTRTIGEDHARSKASEAKPELPGLPVSATVEDYLATAFARNPGLKRALRNAEAAGYEIARATSLPDPSLTVVPSSGDLTETAAGQVSGAIGISQKIPFPAKLYTRGRAASHVAAAAYEAYRGELLRLRAEVRRAFYVLYFADRSIELTTKSRNLLRDFRNIAARKYETGRVPQQDVLRAQVELYDLENQLITLRQSRDTARARLNRLMSYPVNRPLPVTTPIKAAKVQVELAELIATASETNPDIAAARENIERARASLKLAQLDYLPDVTVDYRYTEIDSSGVSPVANGKDNRQLTLGITLPIWFGRLGAGREQAEARLQASRQALTEVEDSTAFEIQEGMLKVDAEQRLVQLFGSVIVPEARQTLDATVSAYRAGQVDFLTFVENWRRLLDFEISYEKSLSSFQQELAELERLIGASLPISPTGLEIES